MLPGTVMLRTLGKKAVVVKLESTLENEMHPILWDFEIQTDHPITAKRPNPVLINKKKRTYYLVVVAIPTNHRVKIKDNEKIHKYLDPARELKKRVILLLSVHMELSPKVWKRDFGRWG